MGETVRIAIDAMGGDYAPQEIVKGAISALEEEQVELVLVGREDILHQRLNRHKLNDPMLSLFEARDVIAMDDDPVLAVRQKRDSSIAAGMNLLKEGKVSAFVSAGNTGAIMTTALLTLGNQEGVERPALGIILSAPTGPVLFTDVGANADCKPPLLVQIAHMGSFYMNRVFDIPRPRIGLLSTGKEENKGNRLIKEANQLLWSSGLNFIGNIEAQDIPAGVADIVVTDGFTGNVVIKLAEGLGELFINVSRQGATGKLSHIMTPSLLKTVEKRLLDYSGHGVAFLLGVNGNVIVAHGRSETEGIKRAIAVAKQIAEHEVHYG
jgi:glycerol-3-phosphate acyltransferase PlsX